MRSVCAAAHCKTKSKTAGVLSLFRFPKDQKRCKEWVVNSGRNDLSDISPELLHKHHVLCSLHFEDQQFTSHLKNRLTSQAVPTIFDDAATAHSLERMKLDMKRSVVIERTPPVASVQDVTLVTSANVSSVESVAMEKPGRIPIVLSGQLEEELSGLGVRVITPEKTASMPGLIFSTLLKAASIHCVEGGIPAKEKSGISTANRLTQVQKKTEQSWTSPQKELTSKLYEFCKTGQFCDTVITTENDHQFWAHSAILAAASDALHSQLSSAFHLMKRELCFYIPLSNCDPDAVQVVLRFIYTGRLVVPRSCVVSKFMSKVQVACQSFGVPFSRLNNVQLTFRESETDASQTCTKSSGPSILIDPLKSTQSTGCSKVINVCLPAATAVCRSTNVTTVSSEWVEPTQCVSSESSLVGSARGTVHLGEDETPSVLRKTDDRMETRNNADSSEQSSSNSLSTSRDNYRSFPISSLPSQSNEPIYDSSSLLLSMLEAARKAPTPFRAEKSIASPKRFKCPKCDHAFETAAARFQHIRQTHKLLRSTQRQAAREDKARPQRPYRCEPCDLTFRFYTAHRKHEIEVHGDGTKSYLCEICGAGFLLPWNLRLHMGVHSRPYRCEKCGKTYRTKGALNNHALSCLTVGGTKPYICDVCGTGFTLGCNLRRHALSHATGQLSCSDCGKSFNHKQNLDVHVRNVHFGLMRSAKHSCATCGRAFGWKCRLLRHQATVHGRAPSSWRIKTKGCVDKKLGRPRVKKPVKEKVGPHVCTICQQGFGLARNLSNHMFVHKEHESFRCETCGKEFSHRRYLTMHGKVHDLEKKYECALCNKKFTLEKVLNRHVLTAHAELETTDHGTVAIERFGVEVEISG